jgi:hypothetical protein
MGGLSRSFRPEVTICPTCQQPLRSSATLSDLAVITLDVPLKLVHRGYRSALAHALALPGFTFGIDIAILGHRSTNGEGD